MWETNPDQPKGTCEISAISQVLRYEYNSEQSRNLELRQMEMMEISGVTNGHPKVLVVDQTKNADGFEYGTSTFIFECIEDNHVSLATPAVVQVNSSSELTTALKDHDFNVLLVFAHGGAGAESHIGSGEAGGICFGKDDFLPWQTYGLFLENLTDKVVVMCICEGMNIDSAWTLFQQKFVLTLVGSSSTITGQQAENFFPSLFDCLKRKCAAEIRPEIAEECVEAHDSKVNGIMSCRYGSQTDM